MRERGEALDIVIPAGTLVFVGRSAQLMVELSQDVKGCMRRVDYNESPIARMVFDVPCAEKSEPSSIT